MFRSTLVESKYVLDPKLRMRLRLDSDVAKEDTKLQFTPKFSYLSFADIKQSRSEGSSCYDLGIVWQFKITSPLEFAERASKQLAANPDGKVSVLKVEMSGRYYNP